ncbi:MAG: arsenate reductase ArsC [Candidatus Hodarchaeales archaeon]|jgi:arsenate reductase
MVTPKKTVLFVCTHNSARSILAESLLRKKHGESFQIFSAGTNPTTINPYVVKILAKMEIDISNLKSKHVNEFLGRTIDFVITVCDSAKEDCPFFPGAKQYLHKSFDDPSTFTGSDEVILKEVQRVRDEISKWIEEEFVPIS